jgi:Holliday junction resolvase RusA-like endonuclease
MKPAMHMNFPWPPSETSANANSPGNWRRKSNAARDFKTHCAWLLRAANIKPLPLESVRVEITFSPPKTVSRFDLDNMLGRIKQGLDAVAEYIGIDDSAWVEMRLLRGPKGGAGSVTVEVFPVNDPKAKAPGINRGP